MWRVPNMPPSRARNAHMANESGELIGVVGVGRMGLAIAKHLMKHRYRVIAQDIDGKAMEAARAAGAKTVATPAELGKEAGFVIVAGGYDDETAARMVHKGGPPLNTAAHNGVFG